MPEIKESFGSGGANLTPADSSGQPSLAEVLRAFVDDLEAITADPVWTDELTVAADVVTLAGRGTPVAVEATTATSAGVKQIQHSGTPAAGFVQVEFTDGVATLTFNSVDAVTGARVLYVPTPTPTVTKG